MTFEKLAYEVAKSFREDMKEGDFETFDEMKQCYWWDTNDIKDEVDYVLRDVSNEKAYIDELDRTDVFNHTDSKEEMISYKKFSGMWRKALNQMLETNEEMSDEDDSEEDRDFSIECERYNPSALGHCLQKLELNIPNFDDWSVTINAGGIDYGIYLNISTAKKEIEICNQPLYGSDGDDSLEDLFEYLD